MRIITNDMIKPKKRNALIHPTPSQSCVPPANNLIKTSLLIISTVINPNFIKILKSVIYIISNVINPINTGVQLIEKGGLICPK